VRTPDPWLLMNKWHIATVAGVVGCIGIIMMWLGSNQPETPLRVAGLGLLVAAFIGWAWMKNKTTPEPGDWLEYLEAQAAEEGHQEWLDSVQTRFMAAWGIKSMKEISE